MSGQLVVAGLTRAYPESSAPALADVDLAVPAGACVAVLGPSGSGKSTLLRLLSGLDRPDRGDVVLDGGSVLDVPPERRGMAMVFQRPLLFPHQSVLDNVAFPARVRGVPRRRARAEAEEYLGLVHLPGLGRRRPGQLSGGQQQRVALARALAARPRVLLLDEPFTGLDTSLREEMHQLVRQLRAALSPTIVLVTHDQAEAVALADTVAVLSTGRLVQHDTADRIYTRPASLAVSRQLGGRNEVTGEVRGHHHHSVLGRLTLPVDVRPPDGAGVLVFRHESVQVTDPGDARADARGTVTVVRTAGARCLLTIEIDVDAGIDEAARGVQVHAEVPPGHRASVGDRVGVAVPPHALAVVPDPGSAGPAAAEPPFPGRGRPEGPGRRHPAARTSATS